MTLLKKVVELDADVRIISKPIFFPSHKFKLIYLVPCDRNDPVSNLGDEQTMTRFTNLRMGVFNRKCLSLIQGTLTKGSRSVFPASSLV